MLEKLFHTDVLFNLDQTILIVVCTLLLVSLILFIFSAKRFLRGKPLSASFQSLSGTTLGLSGLLTLSISANFYSYDRLTHEQDVAKLKFTQIQEQEFQLIIEYPDNRVTDTFFLSGDEWQIDARILKWHGWAQLLGLDAQYRLDRISGRYTDIDEELTKKRTVYALNDFNEIDYWSMMKDYKKWIPFVDAYYGSATYLPMIDNSIYSLSLTQSGLIARKIEH